MYRYSKSTVTLPDFPIFRVIGPSENRLKSDMTDSPNFSISEIRGDRFTDSCVHTALFSGNLLQKVDSKKSGSGTTALGRNKHTTQKQNNWEICLVTGVQLMCKIYYELPTSNHRTKSTKVKSDQVNYRHCSKISCK